MAFSLKRLLVGQPIATERAHHQRLPKVIALAVFASDALSSTAYATEEIMLALMLTVSGPRRRAATSCTALPIGWHQRAAGDCGDCRIAKRFMRIRKAAARIWWPRKISDNEPDLSRRRRC